MIKSMKLYNNVYRIFNELKYIGKYKSKYLKVKDLTKFDQLHYNGTKAIDFAIKKLKIRPNTLVLEIGSGIGGPARYISYKRSLIRLLLNLGSAQLLRRLEPNRPFRPPKKDHDCHFKN